MTRACVDELVAMVRRLLQAGEYDEPAAIEAFRELLDVYGTALVGAALATVEHSQAAQRDHVPDLPTMRSARSVIGSRLLLTSASTGKQRSTQGTIIGE